MPLPSQIGSQTHLLVGGSGRSPPETEYRREFLHQRGIFRPARDVHVFGRVGLMIVEFNGDNLRRIPHRLPER